MTEAPDPAVEAPGAPVLAGKRVDFAPPCRLRPIWINSLDLAWMRDYTAYIAAQAVPIFLEGRWVYEYHVGHSEMTSKSMDPNDSYRAVAGRVYAKANSLEQQRKAVLTFDRTGVGQAVSEIFMDHRDRPRWLPVWPIVSTDGGAPTGAGTHLNVPKLAMVGTLQVVLESRRLKIAKDLTHTKEMKEQLKKYIFKVRGKRLTFNAKTEEVHDDFVTAFMQMTWVGEFLLSRMEPGGLVKVTRS